LFDSSSTGHYLSLITVTPIHWIVITFHKALTSAYLRQPPSVTTTCHGGYNTAVAND